MCILITLRLVLLSGLLYVRCSESDTSDDDTSYVLETSEDEDYIRVMGLAESTTTTTTKTVTKRRRTTKNRGTTAKDAGVPLYKPNATEKERLNKQYEAWLSATPTTPRIKEPEPEGPFYGFIKNMCNVTITRLSGRKIKIFLKVLAIRLKGGGCGFIMKNWIRHFRKKIKLIADYKVKFIKAYAQLFCNYITEYRHFKNLFFNTINTIFSPYDDNRFDDYVYDLKRFGAGRLKSLISINEKTRYVFRRIIQKRLVSQKKNVLDNIILKFDLLLIEYYGFKKKGLVHF